VRISTKIAHFSWTNRDPEQRSFLLRRNSDYDSLMDINLLVLNVGNSRLAIGGFVDGKLEFSTRVPHEHRAVWPGKIADAWKRVSATGDAAVAGANVNPAMIESLEHVVEKATEKKIEWVGRDLDVPIPVLTENPKETGIDRILNVAAAFEQMQKACVVVDAGTALTVDVCNDRGEFLGGAITAGAGMMLDTLHQHTAKLPRISLAAPTGLIGRNTEQAILLGVHTGIRGMVKELVEGYATELGSWPDLIATGGDAEKLFSGWELAHAVSPDLTLYGIALAYTNHYIKHEGH
jgi:type III pantothenate kinase